jgi:hypothetical protein
MYYQHTFIAGHPDTAPVGQTERRIYPAEGRRSIRSCRINPAFRGQCPETP